MYWEDETDNFGRIQLQNIRLLQKFILKEPSFHKEDLFFNFPSFLPLKDFSCIFTFLPGQLQLHIMYKIEKF